jgi:hypothetical protein
MTTKEKIFYLEISLPNDVLRYYSENGDYVLYTFIDNYHKYYLRVDEAFEYFVNGILPNRYLKYD